MKKAKQIKKAKPFSRLTKQEKRIIIAKDALAQIKLGNIIPTLGIYVGPLFEVNETVELQTLLQKKGNKCEACAKGSIFLADILKRDKFKVSRWFDKYTTDSSDIIDRATYFTQNQLDLIETAFEREVISSTNFLIESEDIWGENVFYTDIGKKAIKFGNRYKSDKNRLIAILENIIKNKGEFKP